MQQGLRSISVGSISSLLLLRTLSVGSLSSLLLRRTKNKQNWRNSTLNILSTISQHFPLRCAPRRLVIQRLHRTLATLATLSNLATLSKHFFFRCAPGRLVMRRYQIRFLHEAATA